MWTGIGAVGAASPALCCSVSPLTRCAWRVWLNRIGDYWSETQHSLTTGLLTQINLLTSNPSRVATASISCSLRQKWLACGRVSTGSRGPAANQRMAVFPIECNNVITAIKGPKNDTFSAARVGAPVKYASLHSAATFLCQGYSLY